MRRIRRLGVGLGAFVLLAALVVAWQPIWIFSLLEAVSPRIVWRVDTSQPLVALTFDDGPASDHTPRVLEILARHRARATFFLVGDRAAADPGLVERLRREGHQIASHSYTLRRTTRLTDAEFEADLARTEGVLRLSGQKLFRPAGGRIRGSQLDLAERRGYRVVLGSAYPYDPSHPPAAYVGWLVGKNLAPGTIIVLHDGIADPSRTIAALDGVLAHGREKGLRFVTVGELLASGDLPRASFSSGGAR